MHLLTIEKPIPESCDETTSHNELEEELLIQEDSRREQKK